MQARRDLSSKQAQKAFLDRKQVNNTGLRSGRLQVGAQNKCNCVVFT